MNDYAKLYAAARKEINNLRAARDDLEAALESAADTIQTLVDLGRIPANNKGLRDARAALAKVQAPEQARAA